MPNNKHGITIGLERINAEIFVYIKATGRLTHADYSILAPMLERALETVTAPEVKVLVDAREFEGWELRAAWDDFRLGLRHGNQFSHIAIVGSLRWLRAASAMAGWFLSGEVQFFEQPEEAIAWLEQAEEHTEEPARS